MEDAGLTGPGFDDIIEEARKRRTKRKLTAKTRLRWRFPISYRIGGKAALVQVTHWGGKDN